MSTKIITQPIIQRVTKSVGQNDKQPYVVSCELSQLPLVLCVLHPPLFQFTSLSILLLLPLITQDFQGEHSPVSVDKCSIHTNTPAHIHTTLPSSCQTNL